MKKYYFLVKPSNFKRYGNIDINGNVEEIQCDDFDVPREEENVLIFEGYCYGESEDDIEIYPEVKEFITGENFALEFVDSKDEEVHKAYLSSDSLGLYSSCSFDLESIEVEPIKISGLLMYLDQNEKDKSKYCGELKEMFEKAKAFKRLFDNSYYRPSKYVTRKLRREYKQTR